MRKNYLVFDGRKTTDWGVFVYASDSWNGTGREVDAAYVPGRDGAIITDEGYFNNVPVSYSAFLLSEKEAEEKIADFRDFLTAHSTKYFRLEDICHPDEYRMARFDGPLKPEVKWMNGFSKFTISFDCKPQRYLKSGEIAEDVTGKASIYNPTRNNAKPIITVSGSGVFKIGGFNFTKTSDGEMTIDCETGKMTGGNESALYWDDLYSLPYLAPGKNEIDSGTLQIKITPRWIRR